MDTSYDLAAKMHKFPVEEVLKANDFMENYDEELFKKFLNQIQITNLKLLLFS